MDRKVGNEKKSPDRLGVFFSLFLHFGRFFFGEDFDFTRADTAVDHPEFYGGAFGDIDHAAFDVGAAVGNFEDDGFSVAFVGDADLGAHGEGFVSGGHGVVPKWNTTGCVCAAIALNFIPRCLTVNDTDYFMFVLLFLGKLSLA